MVINRKHSGFGLNLALLEVNPYMIGARETLYCPRIYSIVCYQFLKFTLIGRARTEMLFFRRIKRQGVGIEPLQLANFAPCWLPGLDKSGCSQIGSVGHRPESKPRLLGFHLGSNCLP
jgi:hypothetical protein